MASNCLGYLSFSGIFCSCAIALVFWQNSLLLGLYPDFYLFEDCLSRECEERCRRVEESVTVLFLPYILLFRVIIAV
jgi:hypothetical protein